MNIRVTLFLLSLFALPSGLLAQDEFFLNQNALRVIMDRQGGDIDEVPQVFYNYFIATETSTLRNRIGLYQFIGANGNDETSLEKQNMVQLINRRNLEDIQKGDTVIVPTAYDLDFRAYAPFPRYYPAGKTLGKIVILAKEIQAFAAYEEGKLVRWGIINTGAESSRTPTGRFNVNYRDSSKVSGLSPALTRDPNDGDEEWVMTWVMNIHETRGIHMHQYAMPTAGPASHGCVRMNDADALFLFNWVDLWKHSGGNGERTLPRRPERVQKQGTMVLVLGPDPVGKPKPFVFKTRYPILRIVELPLDPYTIPAGTDQQTTFDRLRNRSTATPQRPNNRNTAQQQSNTPRTRN
jgi:L,D-transpeptidase catalytic domain